MLACLQVWRYKDSIATKLRERELALTTGDPASRSSAPNDYDWEDRAEMLVHVGGLIESDTGSASPSSPEGGIKRASPPPTAQHDEHDVASSSGPSLAASSAASASTGSLPSALEAEEEEEQEDAPTPALPLPPPSESAAQHAVRTATESARSKTLVPRTAYLSPSATTSTLRTGDGTGPDSTGNGAGDDDNDGGRGRRRRTEREAKEAVRLEGGIALDPDREVMLQFLVGKTGDRHAKLPVMVRSFPPSCALLRALVLETPDHLSVRFPPRGGGFFAVGSWLVPPNQPLSGPVPPPLPNTCLALDRPLSP